MSEAKTFEEALLLYLPEVNAGTIKTIVAAHDRDLAAAKVEQTKAALDTYDAYAPHVDSHGIRRALVGMLEYLEQRAVEAQKAGE